MVSGTSTLRKQNISIPALTLSCYVILHLNDSFNVIFVFRTPQAQSLSNTIARSLLYKA